MDTATGEIDVGGIGRVSSIIAIQSLSSLVLRRISSPLPLTGYENRPDTAPLFPDARQFVGPLIS